jgi:hypothetical protein
MGASNKRRRTGSASSPTSQSPSSTSKRSSTASGKPSITTAPPIVPQRTIPRSRPRRPAKALHTSTRGLCAAPPLLANFQVRSRAFVLPCRHEGMSSSRPRHKSLPAFAPAHLEGKRGPAGSGMYDGSRYRLPSTAAFKIYSGRIRTSIRAHRTRADITISPTWGRGTNSGFRSDRFAAGENKTTPLHLRHG